MTLADAVRLALRNLAQAKLRTALTTLGVSIGIASLAGMVSLGVGLQDQAVGRFTRSGMFDAITVMSGRDLPGGLAQLGGARRGGRPRGGAGEPDRPRPILDDAAVRQLAALEHVRDVYPNLRVPLDVRIRQFSQITSAIGVPMSARGEGAFQSMSFGEFLTGGGAGQCMLSLDMAKQIDESTPGSLVGQSLTLGYASGGGVTNLPFPGKPPVPVQRAESACRVTGIVERETAPGPLAGGLVSAVMIPLAKALEINAGAPPGPQGILRPSAGRPYQALTVKVARAQDTQDVEDRIRALGYSAFSLNDALAGAKRFFIILDIVLSLIGSIALAVSSLGIVNTMVMSILERTREIGIMKAIGGSDGDIRRIFLIEASTIGLLGGCAGIVLGWSVGRIINFGANIYIERQGGTAGNLFALPFWLVGGTLVFSVIVSLVAGSYPAARAARLDPIQALRHD